MLKSARMTMLAVGFCLAAGRAEAQAVTGIVASVDAQGNASVSWGAYPGATTYFVVRWNQGDPACCKMVSPPEAVSTALSWQDGVLPKVGTYGYRVYATTPTGTYAGEVLLRYAAGTATSSAGSATGTARTGTLVGATPTPAPAPTPVPPPSTLATAAAPALAPALLAGPTELRTHSLALQVGIGVETGWGIVLRWSPVANATGYRVSRTVTGSGVPAAPVNVIVVPDLAGGSGLVTAVDPSVTPWYSYTYWVEAVLSGSGLTGPSPISTVDAFGPQAHTFNLQASASATRSLVMPGPLAARGPMPGSTVTWTWTPNSLVFQYEASYEIVGGVPGFGTLFERFSVPTSGSPPSAAPVTRPVPQGAQVKLCVALFADPDRSQPLHSTATCQTTQVP
jgi:hypothetical protein